jgi:hypothetical protein
MASRRLQNLGSRTSEANYILTITKRTAILNGFAAVIFLFVFRW